MKRRSFLKALCASPIIGLIKPKKDEDTYEDTHEEFLDMLKRHHASSEDIRNETIEKIGGYPLGARKEIGFGVNRKVFRYCKSAAPAGEVIKAGGMCVGVSDGNGWTQTYGHFNAKVG